MDPFETRLKSLPLRKPSKEFGEPETFAAATGSAKPSTSLFERVNNMPWKLKSAGIVGFAASLAAVYFVFSNPIGGTEAFAQVLEQLSKAETVSYDAVVTRDSDGSVMHRSKEYFLAPRKHRSESVGSPNGVSYVVADSTAGKAIFVDSQRKTVRVSSLKGMPDRDMASERIREMRALQLDEGVSIGTRQIDGVQADGYRFKEKHMTTTLWTSVATGKLLRFEHRLNKSADDPVTVAWTNISFDEPLDESLFSMKTPNGYTETPFLPIDMNASPATWVAAFLELYSKHMDGALPKQINKIPDLGMEIRKKGGREVDEAQLAFYVAAIHAVINRTEQGSDWQYFSNVTGNNKEKIVFWIKNRRKDGYTAIFGDLRVEGVAKDQLPAR